MNYKQAIELLTSQSKFHINLGLERVEAVLNLLANPQDEMKVIHVAGTNGKGSVCSIIANVLKCANQKVGLYTSPHLVEYTERIKINGVEIEQDEFADYVQKVCDLADKHKIDLTEFEILTAVAFKYFADKKVEYAVIETGLGGRYDATNVCKKPLISIITSISLDHTDRLGKTIDEIAYEKAGIIKPNTNVIVAQNNKGFGIIKDVSEKQNAKLNVVVDNIELKYANGKNYAVIDGAKYEFGLIGSYQKENLAIVKCALDILNTDKKVLVEGLKTVKWPARLEFVKDKNVLIDGAHNPEAAVELKKSLNYYFPNEKRKFIYSTISTKDYVEVAKKLFNPDDEIYYYEFSYHNAVKFDEYCQKVDWLKNIKKVDKKEVETLINSDEFTIVTGSLYMIGELYKSIVE